VAETVTYVEMTAPGQLVPAAPVPGLTLEPVGMVSYHLHPGGDSEILTFGFWLHTSSFDNPRALPNYHLRGFRTFKTEPGQRD
jgi:hypothetical protein